MALIKCPECGKSFSDKAAACPECGCPADYAVKEVEKKKAKTEEVYTSHTSTIEVYQSVLEQEWANYLDYHKLSCRVDAEARSYAEKFVDKQIEDEETSLQTLTEKRASLGLFAFSEKKAVDEQIAQQTSRIREIKSTRSDNVASLWLTLSVGDLDDELFIQHANQLSSLIQLHKEYNEATERLMFPAEYGWDLSQTELMSKSEFESGFRDRFIAAILQKCLDELGKVSLEKFSQLSGISIPEIDSAIFCMKSASKDFDPDTGEELLVQYEWKPPVRGRGTYSSSGGSSFIPDFSQLHKGKSASVVGRAALGAVIAGPVGAIVGALSAANQNRR